jgi:hypothetical protein
VRSRMASCAVAVILASARIASLHAQG